MSPRRKLKSKGNPRAIALFSKPYEPVRRPCEGGCGTQLQVLDGEGRRLGRTCTACCLKQAVEVREERKEAARRAWSESGKRNIARMHEANRMRGPGNRLKPKRRRPLTQQARPALTTDATVEHEGELIVAAKKAAPKKTAKKSAAKKKEAKPREPAKYTERCLLSMSPDTMKAVRAAHKAGKIPSIRGWMRECVEKAVAKL